MRNLDPSYDPRVVHFDHGLRGEDSSLDRQLVVDTCKRLRGDFEVYVREWEEGNSKHPKGLQDAARCWRSQELEQAIFEMLEKNEGVKTKAVDLGGGYQALCQGGDVRVVEPESRERELSCTRICVRLHADRRSHDHKLC
ncbi:hypothetical protein AAMO2058_000754700 [Amorphochlora amoebiformis]